MIGSGLLEIRPIPREAVTSLGNECWAWLAGGADGRLGDFMSFCFSPEHGGEPHGLSFSSSWVCTKHVGHGAW